MSPRLRRHQWRLIILHLMQGLLTMTIVAVIATAVMAVTAVTAVIAVLVVMYKMMTVMNVAVDSEDELMHGECFPSAGWKTVVFLSSLNNDQAGLSLPEVWCRS